MRGTHRHNVEKEAAWNNVKPYEKASGSSALYLASRYVHKLQSSASPMTLPVPVPGDGQDRTRTNPGIGHKRRNHALLTAILTLTIVALLGCRSPQISAAPLRIAVLPILDTLPLYIAEAEGYFAAEGLNVELIPVASAAERDQLLQADQVDGVITDLVALALYNRRAPQVIGLRYAMVPTETYAQFRLLAAAGSEIETIQELRGVPVGVSKGTIIEYVTERMLVAEGLPPEAVTTLAVPKIPERMALLNSGDLSAATLPEPLASLVIQQGATPVIDDRAHPELSCSLYAFRAPVIEARPEAVTAFLTAVERATETLNADPVRWEPLLREQRVIPPTLEGALVLPTYPTAAVPDREQFEDVVAWLRENDRLESSPAYGDVVDDQYLTE